MKREALTEALSKIEGLSGPDRELDAAIIRSLAGGSRDHWFDAWGEWTSDDKAPPLTASLDASLALVERLLPGWSWRIGNRPGGGAWVKLGTSHQEYLGATPALAILAALFKVLIAQFPGAPRE